MLCGIKSRHHKVQKRREADPNASLHYGAVTCMKAKKRKSYVQDKENQPTYVNIDFIHDSQPILNTALQTNSLSALDSCAESSVVRSQRKVGCLQKAPKRTHKGRKDLQASKRALGDLAHDSTGGMYTGPARGLNRRPIPFLLSPPGQSRVPVDDDSYTGMSLSYASSVYTASIASEAYDESPASLSSNRCRSRASRYSRCSRSSRTSTRRPDPVGAPDNTINTCYSSDKESLLTSPIYINQVEDVTMTTMTDCDDCSGTHRDLALSSHVSSTSSCTSTNPSSLSASSLTSGSLNIDITLEDKEEVYLLCKVLAGDGLMCETGPVLNSFVETSVITSSGQIIQTSTSCLQENTQSPNYDHHIQITMEDCSQDSMLQISVHSKTNGCRLPIGCLTFKLKALLSRTKKQKSLRTSSDSWYQLLPARQNGEKPCSSHIRRPPPPPPQSPEHKDNHDESSKLSCADISDISTQTPIKLVIPKAETGYGFTVKGLGPVRVGRVTHTSSSYKAGLRNGDVILRINGQDVTKKKSTLIAKMVRESFHQITLDVIRPTASTPVKPSTENTSASMENLTLINSMASPLAKYLKAPVPQQKPQPVKQEVSSRLPWQPQLSMIKEERSSMAQNDTLLYNESNVQTDSLLYNESTKMSADVSLASTATVSTKWDPDISHIAGHENIYEEIQDETDADYSSALWHLSDTMMSGDTAFLGNDDVSMGTEDNSWMNESLESDVMSFWSNATSVDASVFDDKQVCRESLVQVEQSFVELMHCGIDKFSRPLRHRSLLPMCKHNQIFQNIEKLVRLSEVTIKDLQKDTKHAETPISNIVHVYNEKLHLLCEAYQTYLSGLPKALSLVKSLLKHNAEVANFFQRAYQQDFLLSIESFLEKPVQHILDLVCVLDLIRQSCTSPHPEVESLDDILTALRGSVANATQADRQSQKSTSVSSLDSGISHCSSHASLGKTGLSHNTSHAPLQTTTHMHSQLNGSSGYMSMMGTSRLGDSTMMKPSHTSRLFSQSQTSVAPVDQQLLELQDKLHFPSDIKPVSLAAPHRHLVFSGQLTCGSLSAQGWLCNDLLMLTTPTSDARKPVKALAAPVPLADVYDMDFGDDNSSQFSICLSGSYTIQLSAPSVGEKFAWRSLLQHHTKVNSSLAQSLSAQQQQQRQCLLQI